MVSILPRISSFSQSLFQAFRDSSKGTNKNWYHRHSYSTTFQFSGKIKVFVYLFAFFYILYDPLEPQNPVEDKFLFLAN